MRRPNFGKLIVAGLAALTVMAAVPSTPAEASVSMTNAINWALAIAADDSYGYSQDNAKRWGTPSYDCSSLVISALRAGGYETGNAAYTGNMVSELTKYGWTALLAEDLDTASGYSNLKKGDILLRRTSSSGHTELYIGGGQVVKAAYDEDGKDGDSSGLEIRKGNYYDGKWTYVLRYTGSDDGLTSTSPTAPDIDKTSITKSSVTVNSVKITWGAVSDASGYEVNYSTSKNGTYTRAYVTSGTSYTLEGARADTIYYFKVRPYIVVSGVRTYADYSDIYSAKTDYVSEAFASVTTNASLNLRAGAGTSYTRLTTIPKATSLGVCATKNDSSGDDWYLVNYSGHTGYVSAVYTTVQVGKVASLSKKTVTEDSVKISWSPVEYANYYQIYRSASRSSGYKKVKTVKSTELTWTNSSLKASTKYYYKVRALVKINGTNYTGTCSPILAVKTSAASATAVTCQVKTVYPAALRTGAGISNTQLTEIPKGTVIPAAEIRLDASGNPWYKVTYQKQTGYISAVTMKVFVPQADGLSKVSAGETALEIKWSAVPGADYYAVYRSVSKTSGFEKIAEAKTASFADSNLKESTAYYYKVRAYQTVSGKTYYGAASEVTGVKTAKKTSIDVSCQVKTVYEAALRSDAGVSASKYLDIPAGEILKATAVKPDANGIDWYRVTYQKQTGYISSVTMKVYVPTVDGLAKVSANASAVKISWNAAENAELYAVYRSVSKSSGYTKIAETASKAYTDKTVKSGTAYYYKVRAYQTVNGKSYYGAVSEPLKVKAAESESGSSVLCHIRTTGSLNMRTGPATTYDQITTVPSGTELDVYAKATDDRGVVWYQVTYQGNTGWISSKYTETVTGIGVKDPELTLAAEEETESSYSDAVETETSYSDEEETETSYAGVEEMDSSYTDEKGTEMEKEYEELMEDEQFLTLIMDDGTEEEVEILMIFDLEFGGITRDYIALVEVDPETGEEREDSDIILYRYAEDEGGNALLDDIETDEEFEAVSAEFDRLLAELEASEEA